MSEGLNGVGLVHVCFSSAYNRASKCLVMSAQQASVTNERINAELPAQRRMLEGDANAQVTVVTGCSRCDGGGA